MAFTYKDYAKQILSLLPKGDFWSKESGSEFYKLAEGLGEELARIEQKSEDLIDETFADTIVETLEEWEEDFDIPSEGFTLEPTITGRRAVIKARKLATGGQFDNYFIEIGSNLGWTISVTTFSKFLPGLTLVGDESFSITKKGRFYWIVNVHVTDHNNANIHQLIHEIRLRKPAESKVLFRFYDVGFTDAFSNAFNAAPWWDGVWWPLSFDRGFSIAFANNSDYIGQFLTGGYTRAFSRAFDNHIAGAFSYDDFGLGFSKPA